MISRWSNPLPREEYTAAKVVICAYEDRWVPITFSSLAEAIRLYHQALLHGTEIFVFPPDLAPWSLVTPNYQQSWH
ncbi:hypothetical protein [Allocoleopsis sp.]|uniref:hypothetical protein n=1 Tax=Allocoleopsis sp. TaxID=3088169 RepID=UPI002FD1F471